MGGDNNLQRSRNNIMITETILGVNIYKLIGKRSDNQVQSISFSGREVDLLIKSMIINNVNQNLTFNPTQW